MGVEPIHPLRVLQHLGHAHATEASRHIRGLFGGQARIHWLFHSYMVRLVCVQDPKDRRWANCDETLKKLTGEKRIKLFGGQKYFSKHIVGK